MRAYGRQAQVMAPPTPPSEYEEQRLAQQRHNRKRALLLGGIFGISWALVLLTNLVPGLKGTVRGDWLALVALVVSLGVVLIGRQWRWERMRARLAPDVLAKDSRAPV